MATEETTITELELAEEVLADMVIPVDTSTDTKSVSLKQLRAWLGSSLPTGFILPAVGRIDDERFSLLDGKTLSKQGTYGAFCAKVEAQVQGGNWFACTEEEYNADLLAYGQCGKFVIGTDYVRIPTITRFIGATITLSSIGRTYRERLPNIKALVPLYAAQGLPYEASYFDYNAGINSVQSDGLSAGAIKIDASLKSSTYQDGAKVQPDHTKYPYYMVISTEGQTASVEIDINKVYEDLNLKANVDLSNANSVAQSFKNMSIAWGVPDYNSKISINSGYLAPCAGCISGTGNFNSGVGQLYINDIEIQYVNSTSNAQSAMFVSVDKNDKITFSNIGSVYFYPFKGVN